MSVDVSPVSYSDSDSKHLSKEENVHNNNNNNVHLCKPHFFLYKVRFFRLSLQGLANIMKSFHLKLVKHISSKNVSPYIILMS